MSFTRCKTVRIETSKVCFSILVSDTEAIQPKYRLVVVSHPQESFEKSEPVGLVRIMTLYNTHLLGTTSQQLVSQRIDDLAAASRLRWIVANLLNGNGRSGQVLETRKSAERSNM